MKKYIVPELMLLGYEENTELCISIISSGDVTTTEDFWTGGDTEGDTD